MHTLQPLGQGIVHLGTTGAGLAHLLSGAMARKNGDDCAVELLGSGQEEGLAVSHGLADEQAGSGQIVGQADFGQAVAVGCTETSQCHCQGMSDRILVHLDTTVAGLAMTGNDCEVEIALANTDHVDWVSAAARLGGPVQVGLGGTVCHAELPVLESNWRLSEDHHLCWALVIYPHYPGCNVVIYPHYPGCGHVACAGPAGLAEGASAAVRQQPVTQPLRPAQPP